MFCGILLRAISPDLFMNLIHYMCSEITLLGGQWVNTLRPRQDGRHFANVVFKCIFLNENVWILIKISLKFDPKGLIDNMPPLVQLMAWHQIGDKPLFEAMMTLLTDAYMRHLELTHGGMNKIINTLNTDRTFSRLFLKEKFSTFIWTNDGGI